jgi:hypothetical protein
LIIIFIQASIPSFFEAKLALDDYEKVFNERSYIGIHVFKPSRFFMFTWVLFQFLPYSAALQCTNLVDG